MENREFYYRQMLDLQEKCRRSEEERIRLEEKYKNLVQESQVRHEACINRLRLRYMRFLEEQRMRDERNNKLLGALDKVDSNLALIATKTQRLNNLKKKYRFQVTPSVDDERAGDSGVASQNDHLDEKLKTLSKERIINRTPLTSTESLYSRCNYHGSLGSSSRIYTSCIQASSPLISPRRLYHYSPQSPSLRSSQVRIPFVYSTHADSNYQSFARASPYHEPANDFGISADSSRFYTNLRSKNNLRSDYTSGLSANVSPRDYRNDISTIIERSSNLLLENDRPRYTSTPYKYISSPPNYTPLESPSYQYKSFESLENKLERYIQQIRDLHEKIDLADATADDEYNTSGDLLNESLSEDRVVNEKTDLDSTSKSKPEADENAGATADEDELGQPKNIDEDDAAGAADKFTTPTDVPAPDKYPEFVAPVIDQNNTIAPQQAGEIAARQVEVAKEITDQVPEPSTDVNHETVEKSSNEMLENVRSDTETEINEAGQRLEILEDKVIEGSEDIQVENKDFTQDEKYPEQNYQENTENYSQPQNQEPSDQNYQQEQGYYQEYQPGSENQTEYTEYNQNYPNYEQNYDQYQYEQDPNQPEQDPNKYEQDPNQYEQSPIQYEQDPNQYQQDPTQYGQEEHQYEQDTNQYGQEQHQYEQDQNQYEQNPNQYEQDSKQYEQDPDKYQQDLNQYEQDPNQYEQDPNQYENYDQGNVNESNDKNNVDSEYQNVQHDEGQPEDTSKERDNSESESTLERNTTSNAQSDFDFN